MVVKDAKNQDENYNWARASRAEDWWDPDSKTGEMIDEWRKIPQQVRARRAGQRLLLVSAHH